MKTLIILELIPEETKIAVVDLTQEQFKELLPSHNYVVNVDNWDDDRNYSHNKVSAMFCDKPEYVDDELLPWLGMALGNEFKGTDIASVEHMIKTGFYM